MRKKNIDHLLFRELKRISPVNVEEAIINIVNGEYDFHSSYLSNLPQEVIALHLEKLLIMGCKFYDYQITGPYYVYDHIQFIKYAKSFAHKISSLKFKDINKHNIITLEYNFLALKAQLASFDIQGKIPFGVKKALMVLAIMYVCTISLSGGDSINVNTTQGVPIPPPPNQFMQETPTQPSLINSKAESNNNYVPLGNTLIEENEEDYSIEAIIKWICAIYNLTQEEFDIVYAVVAAESKAYGNNPARWDSVYEDAYAVINTVFNRTISKRWIWTNENICNLDGSSLYCHVVATDVKGEHQFSAYGNGRYLEYMGRYELPQFQAVIDFLTTRAIKHDYTYFKGDGYELGDIPFEQFVIGGNQFHGPMSLEDRMDYEPVSFSR